MHEITDVLSKRCRVGYIPFPTCSVFLWRCFHVYMNLKFPTTKKVMLCVLPTWGSGVVHQAVRESVPWLLFMRNDFYTARKIIHIIRYDVFGNLPWSMTAFQKGILLKRVPKDMKNYVFKYIFLINSTVQRHFKVPFYLLKS